jgi:hypothetical protein
MYRSALGKARQKGCPKNINDIEDVLVLPGNNRRKTVNTDIFSKYRYWNRVLIRIFLQYIKKTGLHTHSAGSGTGAGSRATS